jgi:hypothetical protein
MPWTVADVERQKAGLSDRQKRQWVRVANGALQSCLGKNQPQAECEASAIRQANGVVGNEGAFNAVRTHATTVGYSIRTEMHQNKKHLVVPVVMMVEGVHHGSHGPLLHLAEELSRWPGSWNGIPVCIMHPEEGGSSISANSPEVIDRQTVGRVYNTQIDGNRLVAEAWLDEEKLRQVSSAALGYILQAKPLDVSIGVWSDDELTSGEWNGEHYNAIARNYRPDHLALLPGAQGACSWEDGCGVRAHMNNGGGGGTTDKLKVLKDLSGLGFAAIEINARGYRERMSAIQAKLDTMDDNTKVHFLQEVYDGYVVYEVLTRESGGPGGLFRQDYTIGANNAVQFTGEPVPVRREVDYVDIVAQTNEGGKTKAMSDKDKKPCCAEKVELIIQSDKTRFGEEDREFLQGLNEHQIEKLMPVEENVKKTTPDEERKLNVEQATQVLRDQLKTQEQWLDLMPKEIKDFTSYGLRLHEEERTQLIKGVQANTDVFTEADLKSRGTDELRRLATATEKEPADYSGRPPGHGPSPHVNAGGPEPMYPPGVNVKEVK